MSNLKQPDSLQPPVCSTLHQARLKILREALARELPDWKIETPECSGSALWIRLPEGLSATKLTAAARDADIVIEPGVGFFGLTPPAEFIRMGISAIPTHLIAEGIAALAAVAHDVRAQV